jgi:hypothetical protein
MENKINQTNKKAELKALVAQTVSEVLNDPDFGKELTKEAEKRLSVVRNRDLENTTPLSVLKEKYL